MADDQKSKRYWRYQPVYIGLTGDGEPDRSVTLCECYFDSDGRLEGWTENPAIAPIGDTIEDLAFSLFAMLGDTYKWKPVQFASLQVGMTFERADPHADRLPHQMDFGNRK